MKFKISPPTGIQVEVTLKAGDDLGALYANLLDELGSYKDAEVIIQSFTLSGTDLVITATIFQE